MTRVFAFIGGRPQVGQSTITAELAFEWVKRGASACILTSRSQIETMGFDCFELSELAPPEAGGQRNLSALAADLAQLDDYDYFILDLPPGSVDLAIAASLSGAELVVPLQVEQGALSDVGALFREIARQPPPRPIQLVLNQVRNSAAAIAAAERLIASIEQKLKLRAHLSATLPWDPDLAALQDPSALLSMTLPTAALVRAMPELADALNGDATAATAPVTMVFWEQLQTLLQQPAARSLPSRKQRLEHQPPLSIESEDASHGQTPPAVAPIPELATQLNRIASSLASLTEEVGRLRSDLTAKFDLGDEGDPEGRRKGGGEPIKLDFEEYRRSHRAAQTRE
ncbi:MAG: hypothetical protein QNJ22_06875 [Desulfosarcinaceae bacterium]|nr:hypothetical protein [Desulfosarcinaceae bacterium]